MFTKKNNPNWSNDYELELEELKKVFKEAELELK